MPIVMTRSKDVPRRLLGYGLDKPSASDLTHPSVTAEVMEDDSDDYYTPQENVPCSTCGPDDGLLPADAEGVIDAAEGHAQKVWGLGPYVTVPFYAYLAFSDKLPGWARLFALFMGAGATLGSDGLIARLRNAGYGDCGCGGSCGGCGGGR